VHECPKATAKGAAFRLQPGHDVGGVARMRRRLQQQIDRPIDVESRRQLVVKRCRKFDGAIHQPVQLEIDHRLDQRVGRWLAPPPILAREVLSLIHI